MPVFKHLKFNNQQLAIWKMDETVDELLQKADLSQADLEKLNTFRHEPRKKEWLTARVLVKTITGRSLQIIYTPSGKPFFKDNSAHLSITHCKGFVGVTISTQPTALDMEIVAQRIAPIHSRFINEKELAFIPANQKLAYFTLIWSAKETLYKLFDKQQVIFKDHLFIEPFQLNQQGTIQANFSFNEIHEKIEMNYMTCPEFTLVYYFKPAHS